MRLKEKEHTSFTFAFLNFLPRFLLDEERSCGGTGACSDQFQLISRLCFVF